MPSRFDEKRQKLCKELKRLSALMDALNENEKQLLENLNSSILSCDLQKFEQFIDKMSGFLNDVSKNREDLSRIITRTFIDPLNNFENAFKVRSVF